MSILIRERVPGFLNKVFRYRTFIEASGDIAPKRNNILFVVTKPEGSCLYLAHNKVTDAGDQYYAQKAVGESPATAFANLYLSTVDWDTGHPDKTSTSDNIASMISGSEKAPSTGYPKTNDADADNTGAGVDVVTWKYSYAKADFSDTDIDAGAIAAASVTSWGSGTGTDNLLTGFDIATAFGKTTNDTLTVYVNHTMNGV